MIPPCSAFLFGGDSFAAACLVWERSCFFVFPPLSFLFFPFCLSLRGRAHSCAGFLSIESVCSFVRAFASGVPKLIPRGASSPFQRIFLFSPPLLPFGVLHTASAFPPGSLEQNHFPPLRPSLPLRPLRFLFYFFFFPTASRSSSNICVRFSSRAARSSEGCQRRGEHL